VSKNVPRATHIGYDRIAAGLTALLWAAPVNASVEPLETFRLDNGAAVVIAPVTNSKLVAVQAWIGAGAADDPSNASGVAHAVEHMLFKGSAGYPGASLTHQMAQAGGDLNAWTSLDHTVMHGVAPASELATLLDGIAQTLIAPTMDAKAFEIERRVILEEIRQSAGDALRLATQSMFATAFQTHPYRRTVIGTAQSVARLELRDVVDYFRRWYVGDNLTLVVTGDVDPAQTLTSCAKAFQLLPAGRIVRRRIQEMQQDGPRTSVTQLGQGEACCSLGFRTPTLRHADFAALDIAACVMGQRDGSRFNARLQNDVAASASASAQLHAMRDPSLFSIAVISQPRHARKALAAIMDEISALPHNLSHDELESAKVAVQGDRIRQLETVGGHAKSLGWNVAMAGESGFHHGFLERIRTLRLSDVAAAMQRHLRAQTASLAVVLPQGKVSAVPAFERYGQRALRLLPSARASTKASPLAVSNSDVTVERRIDLGNGVVVLLRRDPSVAVVATRAVWRGGVRRENLDNNGITNLIAAGLTYGCGNDGRSTLQKKLALLGGGMIGVAGRNSLSVAAEFLSSNWVQGFALFAQCAQLPRFDRPDVLQLQAKVLADIRVTRHLAHNIAYRGFVQTLFGDHPYAMDIAGTEESISSLSVADIKTYFAENYARVPLTISIVGDIDLDEAEKIARSAFAKRTKAVATPVVPIVMSPAPQVAGPRQVFATQSRDSASIVIGFAGTKSNAPDRFAVEAMTAALAGQAGRLFTELRERSGLVYRVSAHSIEGLDPGFIAISLACAPANVDEVVAKVKAELTRLASEGVSGEELLRLQRSMQGMQAVHLQRRAAIASAMAFHEAYGLMWTDWNRYDQQLAAVTAADVQSAARTYLDWNRVVISVVRPPSMSPAAERRSRAGNGRNQRVKPTRGRKKSR
jgi:zinc protease